MKTVAVLGGGPAGAFAAEQLTAQGLRTIVIDEKLAWEKPCGGGITYKAYHQYPFLIDNDAPKKIVRETVLASPDAGSVTLKLQSPLLVYSRFDLNNLLLSRAIHAGADIEKTRVIGIERHASGWRVLTKARQIAADYCIVAMGARNALRDVGTQLSSDDTMLALGYYVPGNRDRIDIQFLADFEGYIWVFPRCGHLSVGICGKGHTAAALRQLLELYMDQQGLSRDGATFFSHLLPSLAAAAWKQNRVAGPGWMAVGDAAGLVDPITGEGLYYAVRSADLAAQAMFADAPDSEVCSAAYRRLLDREFTQDLEFGSRLARKVFRGKFLFGPIPNRMVQFTRRSPRFTSTMQDLFAGTQNYLTLKRRLFGNLHTSLFEMMMSFRTPAQTSVHE